LRAGLGEGIWEWIGWFKSSRPPKGEHVHILGPPLHETQVFESRTSNHHKLKIYARESKLLF
jgi:hypothetical protein